MPGTRLTYEVLVDWNNAGTFTGTNDDITSRVRDIQWTRGRNYASQLVGKTVSGNCIVILDNRSGDYSRFNSSSPLSGSLLPCRHVQINTRLYGRKVTVDGASAYWPLDETSTGSLIDVIGSLAGTPTGTITFGTAAVKEGIGTSDKSIAIAGTNSKVMIPATAAIDDVWDGGGAADLFCIPTTAASTARLLSKGAWEVALVDTAAGSAFLAFSHVDNVGTVATWRTTNKVIILGTRNHVGISFDKDSTNNAPLFFVNGTNEAVTTLQAPSGATFISDSSTLLAIGNNAASTLNPFVGRIDDVVIYTSTANIASAQMLTHFEIGTDEFAGTILWNGMLDTIEVSPQLRKLQEAKLRATGPLAYLNRLDVDIETTKDILSGSAINLILADAKWTTGLHPEGGAIDTGQTTLSWFFIDKQKTINALREVESTEGGFLGEEKDGGIFFEDRHHRLKSPHLTPVSTFSDNPSDTLHFIKINQEDPRQQIFNEFIGDVTLYTTGATATLWVFPATGTLSPKIEPGETRTFWGQYPNATSTSNASFVFPWIDSTATVDYNFFTDQAGTGTNLNGNIALTVSKFSNSIKYEVNNTGTVGAFMTHLQALGVPVSREDPIRVSESDSTSQTSFGVRTFPNPGNFIPSVDEARDWGKFYLSIYKDPIPVLSLSVHGNKDKTHMTEVITRDISDRITVNTTGSSNLGFIRDFFIESENHRIDRHRNHIVTWKVSDSFQFSDFWVLNTSELGTRTRLAY